MNGSKTNLIPTTLAMLLLMSANAKLFGQYELSNLVEFDGTNGSNPLTGVVFDSTGNLYGTTIFGGEYGGGAVIRIDARTGQVSILASFNGLNGTVPMGELLVDNSGNIYGTTWIGGAYDCGTLFRIAADTHQFSTLVTFDRSNQGPGAGLTSDAEGNLYGTTEFGGAYGLGTVFRFSPSTMGLTILGSFDRLNGRYPREAELFVDDAGNLYGTTPHGGSANYGNIFFVDAATGVIRNLLSFNGSNGAHPFAGLIADGVGNLYGTTADGSNSLEGGTVYAFSIRSNTLTTLAKFGAKDGKHGPLGEVVIDSKGNLFGTTAYGGQFDQGTVFKIHAHTNEVETLVSFSGVNGFGPQEGLVADAEGNLYGTTYVGGTYHKGTVFKLTLVPEPSTYLHTVLGLCVAFLRRQAFFIRSNEKKERAASVRASNEGSTISLESGVPERFSLVARKSFRFERPCEESRAFS